MVDRNLNFSEFLNFSNDLNDHIINGGDIFDQKILSLFEKHFNYHTCGITVYNNNYHLIDVIGYNGAITLKDHYLQGYYQKDALSIYITNKIGNINSSETKVITNSGVSAILIEKKKDFEEYKDFLGTAGMSYVAVLPLNKFKSRICLYKSDKEGDFNKEETVFLNYISQYIQSLVPLSQYIATLESCNSIKDSLIDNEKIGLVILNNDFEVLEANNLAVEYLNSAIPHYSNISDFLRGVIAMESSPENTEMNMLNKTISFNGLVFNFFVKPYIINNKYLGRQYVATITNSSIGTDRKHDYKRFSEKFKLSEREMEIIILLSQNLRYSEIADSLFISLNTVRTHIKNIYRKLDIDNERSLLCLFNKYYL